MRMILISMSNHKTIIFVILSRPARPDWSALLTSLRAIFEGALGVSQAVGVFRLPIVQNDRESRLGWVDAGFACAELTRFCDR